MTNVETARRESANFRAAAEKAGRAYGRSWSAMRNERVRWMEHAEKLYGPLAARWTGCAFNRGWESRPDANALRNVA